MPTGKAKLRVGIAGYGVVGKRRRLVIDENPLMHTVAVSDVKLENGPLSDGVWGYSNCDDLLEADLDILFVSLPNNLAPIVTIKGLKKGLHVFCEKPPGRTVKDIQDVIEVEKLNPSLKLKYGFNHRYHHSVREALALVRGGKFGNLFCWWGLYG